MLQTINGKSLLECSLDDLKIIIDNPDYRENESIDYKKEFIINSIPKEDKQNKIAEFRSDVCAFANADGGYLIFGIQEDGKGIPHELYGTQIIDNNVDKFELSIKNYLQTIQPKMPYYQLNFLNISDDKYIIILFIQHDMFAPYIHLEDEKNYRIYKRVGNSKKVIGYSELKNMFIQTMSLEKEVDKFRRERIDYYRAQEDTEKFDYSKFMLIHFIPDTFMDSNYSKSVFLLERRGIKYSDIFKDFQCRNIPTSMVDGLFYSGYQCVSEGRMYNNGVAEIFYPLYEDLNISRGAGPNGFFAYEKIWNMLKSSLQAYMTATKDTFGNKRFFTCVSIIGCKNAQTQNDYKYVPAKIDRDYLLCKPYVFDNSDISSVGLDIKTMYIDYLLSIGIKENKELNKVIKEVYGQ